MKHHIKKIINSGIQPSVKYSFIGLLTGLFLFLVLFPDLLNAAGDTSGDQQSDEKTIIEKASDEKTRKDAKTDINDNDNDDDDDDDDSALLPTDEISRRGLLPTFSYSSDSGISIGGLYQFHQLNVENRVKRLYRFSGSIYLSDGFSVKSMVEERITDAHRVSIFGEATQMSSAYFFGRGSTTSFDNDEFNKYSRLQLDLKAEYGQRISEKGLPSKMEVIFGARVGYIENYDFIGSLLEESQPRGYQGGFRQSFSIGLRGDFRDSYFRPASGSLFDVNLSYFPEMLGNSQSLGKLSGSMASYHSFDFISEVTFAVRFSGEQILARAPYYELSTLGGENSLRGYVLERFRDYGSMYGNFELRTWLLEIPVLKMELGGQLFSDIGALYVHPFEFEWLDEIKVTYGFGGTVSLFNSDFIIRGDVGFSHESWRLYTGIGYLF